MILKVVQMFDGFTNKVKQMWGGKVMYQSNRSYNNPPPGHLNFWKIFV